MRKSVSDLISMGPLPSEDSSDINLIQKYQDILHSIHLPLSDEEALRLVSLFGSDESYGLAWTLLHLIETSGKIFTRNEMAGKVNPWIERLISRSSK